MMITSFLNRLVSQALAFVMTHGVVVMSNAILRKELCIDDSRSITELSVKMVYHPNGDEYSEWLIRPQRTLKPVSPLRPHILIEAQGPP